MCSGLSDGGVEDWGASNLPTSVSLFLFGVCPKEGQGGGRESSLAS